MQVKTKKQKHENNSTKNYSVCSHLKISLSYLIKFDQIVFI